MVYGTGIFNLNEPVKGKVCVLICLFIWLLMPATSYGKTVLGISIASAVDDDLADFEASTTGATIVDVAKGGPASRAGLKPGDRIIGFEGIKVRDEDHLKKLVATMMPGDRLLLTVTRGGERLTFSVELVDEKDVQAKDNPHLIALEAWENGDYQQALELTGPAAQRGENWAQWLLGEMYRLGRGVDKDIVHACRWYAAAVEQGYPAAQVSLGYCYLNGEGVLQDTDRAASLFLLAAEAGKIEAMFKLGLLYREGKGVDKSLTGAFSWMVKAAEQGFAEAQYYVANAYYFGEGVKEDKEEAFKWTLKAAMQGHQLSQLNLGMSYYFGTGTEIDYAKALAWLVIADLQKPGIATKEIAQVKAKMSREQILDAKRLKLIYEQQISASTTSSKPQIAPFKKPKPILLK